MAHQEVPHQGGVCNELTKKHIDATAWQLRTEAMRQRIGKYADSASLKGAEEQSKQAQEFMRRGGHRPASFNIAGHYMGGCRGGHLQAMHDAAWLGGPWRHEGVAAGPGEH